MRRISTTLWVGVLLLLVAGAGPVPIAGLLTNPDAAGVRAETSLFLPLVNRNHRSKPACSADSPFSIQIAALHQVEPGKAGGADSRAEWLAWYQRAFPSLVTALEQSGACWVRVLIDWSQRQPDEPLPGQPPVYNWNPGGDEDRVRALAQTGIRIIGTVEMVPDWARGEPYNGPPPDDNPSLRCTSIDPERLGDFAQFLTDLVNRYKGPPYNIRTWELRNEPDGTTEDRALVGQGCAGFRGDLYAQMLQHAYPAIKAADPDAIVLMGGVAYDHFVEYGQPFYRYFPDDVMENGGAEWLDVITFHYFHDFRAEWERWVPDGNPPTCGIVDDGEGAPYEAWGIDLIAKTNHFRNRLKTCFGVEKPVWVTELAEHGYPGDDESLAQQARYVIQGNVRGLSAGVQNITWYALVSPPYDQEHQGLLYQDTLEPKPAFFAYQTLTAELHGYQYASTRSSSDDIEAYVFIDAQGREKTAAWGSGTSLAFAASQLRIVNRSGTVWYVHDGGPGDLDGIVNGSILLQFGAEPLFVSRVP